MVKYHFGLEALGVSLKALHEIGTLYPHGVGRPVIDVGRRHELSALLHAGDKHGVQVRPCRVDGSAVTSGAGTQY